MPAAKRAPSNRPLLLGHRGARARKSIPENTLASFDQALADGCDGFEFDLRLTADEQAMICHDARSGRIEIARVSARQCAGLPRLEDVLTRYHKRAFLDIELKVAGLEKITIAALRKHPPRQGMVVSSFLPEVLTAIHEEDADIPLGIICETREQLLPWKQLPVTYVIPHQKLVRQELIREVNEFGKKMLVWTVNSRAQMERLSGWGVDGIISDDTKLLARTLK
jgi:glycerophosphoryl diester phosphodiesterase